MPVRTLNRLLLLILYFLFILPIFLLILLIFLFILLLLLFVRDGISFRRGL